jgi:hypothetical protein
MIVYHPDPHPSHLLFLTSSLSIRKATMAPAIHLAIEQADEQHINMDQPVTNDCIENTTYKAESGKIFDKLIQIV